MLKGARDRPTEAREEKATKEATTPEKREDREEPEEDNEISHLYIIKFLHISTYNVEQIFYIQNDFHYSKNIRNLNVSMVFNS